MFPPRTTTKNGSTNPIHKENRSRYPTKGNRLSVDLSNFSAALVSLIFFIMIMFSISSLKLHRCMSPCQQRTKTWPGFSCDVFSLRLVLKHQKPLYCCSTKQQALLLSHSRHPEVWSWGSSRKNQSNVISSPIFPYPWRWF